MAPVRTVAKRMKGNRPKRRGENSRRFYTAGTPVVLVAYALLAGLPATVANFVIGLLSLIVTAVFVLLTSALAIGITVVIVLVGSGVVMLVALGVVWVARAALAWSSDLFDPRKGTSTN